MNPARTPPADRYFWWFHASVWGVFILINFITRQFNGIESLEQGLVSLVVLLLVNTVLCLVLRWVLHRFDLLHSLSPGVWFRLVLLVVLLGFVSAVLSTLGVGFYYLLFGHASTLVFFMVTVYQNWLVLTLMLGIWTVVYLIINHLRQLSQLQSQQHQTQLQLKEAELNHLMGQLNPHFLFNGLNNIRGLMLEDVDRARTMLTDLADLLRYSLNTPKQPLTDLASELAVVQAYIQLCQIQYEDRLQYREEVEPRALPCQVPPMLIQLLVENAIRHGIDRQASPGELYLGVNLASQQLHITVRNPGHWHKPPVAESGLGLANIRKRLALLFGDQATLQVTAQSNQVCIEVVLPALPEAATFAGAPA
ncbi:sensor histidine kinase [Marinicella meishanensis]|uniref:sensor histidine kinase n=1 Tax=Marinicella meishanensis TaxID=2873263 RepID=UPI001CC02137|nr:histidine kinase [Marinicella sp. NBU2979]